MIHLATGIAIREGAILLVASRYPNQPDLLWNLPGGRQQPGELLVETVVREFAEETQLRVHAGELAYLSESYDGSEHFLNATFVVETSGDDLDPRVSRDEHAVEAQWVPLSEVRNRIAVAVVREPLLSYLGGVLDRRYAGFHHAGITIEWPADST